MVTPTLSICLDNLRSAYNVGSIFRTADAAGINQIYLTGITPLPLNPKVQKTALGSEAAVPWAHHCRTEGCLTYLKTQLNYTLISLETDPQATSLFTYQFQDPTCLIVGNEKDGLSSEILGLSDKVIAIPQLGVKESLNVSVAASIAIYEWRRQQTKFTE